MPAPSAFLVLRRAAGYGNVCELAAANRYSIGRTEANDIVLPDEMCSRQHAELYTQGDHWLIRDCQSMNGTRVNGEKLDQERQIRSGDEIALGRSRLVFVHRLADLPPILTSDPDVQLDGIQVIQRLGQTRYDLTSGTTTTPTGKAASWYPLDMERVTSQLALLYRLALMMGAAGDVEELVNALLEELVNTTPADSAAVLRVTPRQELRLTAIKSRVPRISRVQIPQTVLDEVLQARQAVLAEDKNRLRAAKAGVDAISSMIVAPVEVGDHVEFLLILACTNQLQTLTPEDLELVMAIARQLGVHSQGLRRQAELREENERLKAQVASEVQLIGRSPGILAIEEKIMRVSPTTATVLVRGESGVGKELVARAIHLASPRRNGPLVCLNCAALAESILESELFGHERGAFTGATDRKIGKFEAAHQGTIFLDEIGEMPPGAQAKLLRILEGHPYERLGGTEPIRVNVRVVAATNRPLEHAVANGHFRKDLYFRLQVVEIVVPPLRDRVEDIPLLAEYFLNIFRRETGSKIRGFTPGALEKMKQYHWPGNVRELRNVVERAVALATGSSLDASDIWLSNLDKLKGSSSSHRRLISYQPRTLDEMEKEHITATLRFTSWVKSQAAQILGIERSTLDRKIKQYEIQRDEKQ